MEKRIKCITNINLIINTHKSRVRSKISSCINKLKSFGEGARENNSEMLLAGALAVGVGVLILAGFYFPRQSKILYSQAKDLESRKSSLLEKITAGLVMMVFDYHSEADDADFEGADWHAFSSKDQKGTAYDPSSRSYVTVHRRPIATRIEGRYTAIPRSIIRGLYEGSLGISPSDRIVIRKLSSQSSGKASGGFPPRAEGKTIAQPRYFGAYGKSAVDGKWESIKTPYTTSLSLYGPAQWLDVNTQRAARAEAHRPCFVMGQSKPLSDKEVRGDEFYDSRSTMSMTTFSTGSAPDALPPVEEESQQV